MFDTGNILYCQNFEFDDGGPSKTKYFIVLKHDGNDLIVGSLPTRKNKVPNIIDVEHGCVNDDERRINCYVFQAKKAICDNGFCFDLPTFVYGDAIRIQDAKIINSRYILNKNYTFEGKLSGSEFNALLKCFSNSDSVKNKIKRLLPSLKESV